MLLYTLTRGLAVLTLFVGPLATRNFAPADRTEPTDAEAISVRSDKPSGTTITEEGNDACSQGKESEFRLCDKSEQCCPESARWELVFELDVANQASGLIDWCRSLGGAWHCLTAAPHSFCAEPAKLDLDAANARTDPGLGILQREYRQLIAQGLYVEAEQVAARIVEVAPHREVGHRMLMASQLARHTARHQPPRRLVPLVHRVGYESEASESHRPRVFRRPRPPVERSVTRRESTKTIARREATKAVPWRKATRTVVRGRSARFAVVGATTDWHSIASRKVSFHFRGEDLEEVARFFHHVTGMPVRLELDSAGPAPDASGIHILCRDQSVEQALRVVLGSCGLGYRVEGGELIISRPEKIRRTARRRRGPDAAPLWRP